MSTALEPVLV